MKRSLLALGLVLLTTAVFSQETKYQLSSHILDISKGLPATGVSIQLSKLDEKSQEWTLIEEKVTDENGRIPDFLNSDHSNLGIYKLTYLVSDYFKRDGIESFYPFIEVVFQIADEKHYHVPITLSAFGYATYRGN